MYNLLRIRTCIQNGLFQLSRHPLTTGEQITVNYLNFLSRNSWHCIPHDSFKSVVHACAYAQCVGGRGLVCTVFQTSHRTWTHCQTGQPSMPQRIANYLVSKNFIQGSKWMVGCMRGATKLLKMPVFPLLNIQFSKDSVKICPLYLPKFFKWRTRV